MLVAGLVDLWRGGRARLAGWRMDPTGRHQCRYWDGRRWTERVTDGAAENADRLEGFRTAN